MAKDIKEAVAFDALGEIEAARSKAKSAAAKAVRKAKAGGGIAAAAPLLAQHIEASFGDGGEAGFKRSYLTVSCLAKALAEAGSGVFELSERESGPSLSSEEKRSFYEEVKLLVDDRLEPVLGAALSLGEFHLEAQNVPGLVRELQRAEKIAASLSLFGPAAMGSIKPKPRASLKAK